jgi:hypothetical protein
VRRLGNKRGGVFRHKHTCLTLYSGGEKIIL